MKTRRELVPLLLVVAGLGLGELCARALASRAWRPLPPFGRVELQQQWLERNDRELAGTSPSTGYTAFDAELGWTTRPGHVSADGRVHVNSLGLRSAREYEPESASHARRILACGESFTFGEEVSDAEAWTARLEQQLGVEVWNYGVGGYGTDQALLRLTREARGPAATVLVGLMLENIGRNVNRYRPLWYSSAQPAAKPRYVLGKSGLELVPHPFPTRASFVEAVRSDEVLVHLGEHEYWSATVLPGWLGWSTFARLLESKRLYAARDLAPLYADVEGEPFRVTLALLEAFVSLAARHEAELVVLIFPPRTTLRDVVTGGKRYWTPLLEALALRGIRTLDCSEPLAQAVRAEGGIDELYLESHFSPRGNDVIARAIAALSGSLLDGESK